MAVSTRVRRAARDADTVAAWFAEWPKIANVRTPRSPTSIELTMRQAKPFVDAFGSLTWDELQRRRLIVWAAENQKTIRWARTILNDAVWADVVEQNPLDGIKTPKSDFEVTPPTAEQVALLAERCGALGPMVLAAAYSGLRVSELCALDGKDITVGEGRLGRVFVRNGKGGRPRLSLLYEPGLSATLAEQNGRAGVVFRRPVFDHLAAGALSGKYKKVAAPLIGRVRWDRHNVGEHWRRARAGTGLEHVRFHDLRHFHATWLLDQGASSWDVAMQLGHTTDNLVRTTYGHPSREKALERLAALA